MKKLNYKTVKWIPVFLFGLLGIIACEPDEENLGPSRMFMPAGVISQTSSETDVRLSWKVPANTTQRNATYTVEVAEDTLFQTPILFTVNTDTATSVVFTNQQLQIRKPYFARVKTNGVADRPESKWLVSNRFSIRGAQVFVTPVAAEDILDNAALLRWQVRPGLTHIILTTEGEPNRRLDLTGADVAAGLVQVRGLKANAAYRAEIFNNDLTQGFVNFRTRPTQIVGNVVDLSRITGRPTIIRDTIQSTDIPSGSTFILRGGETYTINNSINLDKSYSFRTESGFGLAQATLLFTSAFNAVSGSNIEFIEFHNVKLTGVSYADHYVMNINQATNIGRILFEDCVINEFRGVVRTQQAVAININNFVVNRCIVSRVSNYGIVNVDNINNRINNISITNSTVYKVEKVITSRNNSNTVLLENNTFNEAPWGGGSNYLIDYNTAASNNVTGGVTLRNNILGVGLLNTGSVAVRGIRVNTTTSVEVVNTYSTSDYNATANPIAGLTSYAGSSTDLWVNPQNGNFNFKDASFPGRSTAGDPRWRP